MKKRGHGGKIEEKIKMSWKYKEATDWRGGKGKV